ncbi:MAG: TetR family transcriptional regulator [Acidobacteria bacterium]|nr:MAG: TetR family transcriptional regulator [Acidobacteriota bacterium]
MGPESPATLREQHAEFTQDAILRALSALLEDENPGGISMPDVAATREDLLAAAADWINERMFGTIPFGETVDDLPKIFRYASERWDEHPKLVRAMALSQAGRSVRSHRRAQRLAALRHALAEVTDRLPRREQRKAFAVLGYLENMLAWVTMRDEAGLDGREAGEAVEWAMRTLINDLRRRNNAAGRTRGGKQ